MAVAALARDWRSGLATKTVRHFALAVSFALLAVGFGSVIYFVEKYGLNLEDRFVENPAAVMMQAVGLAHFSIGWLFLFTSPSLRNRPALLRLFWLTLLGVGLCFLCSALGASRNPFIALSLYSFFLVHEIRDETNLYQVYGDNRDERGQGRAFVTALSQAVVVFYAALFSAGWLLHGLAVKHSVLLVALSPWFYLILFTCLACLCCHYWRQAWLLGCEHYGSLRTALKVHEPIVLVYLGVFLVLMLGVVAGSVSFNLIILIHAGAWLVFVCYQLNNRPAPAQRNLWTWVRYTSHGFLILHLAVIALLLVLLAIRVYVLQRSGWFSVLLAGSSFPYWSLMHIAMAFWRPR